MSIHPSLRSGKTATASVRNVLKRHERVRHMVSTGTWSEDRSAFGLPKLKQTKIRARKAAAKEKEAAAAAEKPTTTPGAS